VASGPKFPLCREIAELQTETKNLEFTKKKVLQQTIDANV